jgi:hypothetical protein
VKKVPTSVINSLATGINVCIANSLVVHVSTSKTRSSIKGYVWR